MGTKFGQVKNRGCTDLLCLVIFLIFVVGLFAIGTVGFIYGDLTRLIHPTDSSGKLCGKDNGNGFDFRNKEFLIYFNYLSCLSFNVFKTNGCPTTQVCVSSCPSRSAVLSPSNYKTFISDGYCVGASLEDSYSTVVAESKCPKMILESYDFLMRCIPTIILTNFSLVEGTETPSNVQNILTSMSKIFLGGIEDIIVSKYEILIFFAISVFICCLFIGVLRFFANILITVALLLLLMILGIGTYFCISRYIKLKNSGADAWPSSLTVNILTYGEYYNLNLTIGCILGILFFILLLLILGNWKKIRISVQILKETSKAFGFVWGVLFWTLILICEFMIVTIFCVVVVGYLQTMGERMYRTVSERNITGRIISVFDSVVCNETDLNIAESACRFVKYGDTEIRPYLVVYVLFMWFWLIQFLDGFSVCVISGSFISYYWAYPKPKNIPSFPVTKSYITTLRFHLGSVAFGSLIIAITKFIRAILHYLSEKLKLYDNKFVKSVLIMLKCCFWCFECFLKFLTENAYIQMMINGKGFCASAKASLSIITKNFMGKFVMSFFAKVIVFLCVLSSTALTVFCAYLWFIPTFDKVRNVHSFLKLRDQKLNYVMTPVMVIGIISFLTSRIIFEIYKTGISSIYFCFLVDLEENDGSKEKPYFMAKNLMKILNKMNRKE